MIEAKIVLDSVNPQGSRITSWLLTYPRFIHSEFMTHRVFSRNSASSRAIPPKTLLEMVRSNPAMFEQVGRANKGMQANEIPSERDLDEFKEAWLDLRDRAYALVMEFSSSIAKQVVNRAIEPWMHMTVLATATDHNNFFGLRAHHAADPNFQVLAYRMLDKYLKSTPQRLEWGEWHLPGIDPVGAKMITIEEQLVICTALACRASYSSFEKGIDPDDAQRIHDQGVKNGHWSPFEHPAQAINEKENMGKFWSYPWSNFDTYAHGTCTKSGWGQYRKLFPQESAPYCDLRDVLANKPDWIKL